MSDEKPHRLNYSEIITMALARSGHDTDSMEIGESAQGFAYVKSVKTTRGEDEGWARWAERSADILTYTKTLLRPASDLEAQLAASVEVIDETKRRPRRVK